MSTFYIVSTPIGNLKDITLRALECLKSVTMIFAEDTRHAKILLDHYGILTPLMSLHSHNEHARCEMIAEKLRSGESLAQISDAGTPLISDPGAVLVRRLREAGFSNIHTLPGPCALIAGLSVSGLSTERFYFHGFLPAKSTAREAVLKSLRDHPCTLIFYEAPHRLHDVLLSIQKVFEPTRQLVLAKELTKIHEGVLGGTCAEVLAWLSEDERRYRGEFVLMIEGCLDTQDTEHVTLKIDLLLKTLQESLPQKTAVQIAEKLTGYGRNLLYQRALELKKEG